jgi:ABC-2 type transport system ATP-binding protein
VALAQAIVANPKLLILDEPFSGLDPIGRREFREIFYEIKQAGTTLFMSSHVLSDVEYLCDRASILSHGKLKGVIDLETLDQHQSGSYELVIREYERVEDLVKARAQACVRDEKFLRATFSEESNAREVLRSVLEAGVTVTSFQYIQPRLEDIFVQMVKFEEGGTSTG